MPIRAKAYCKFPGCPKIAVHGPYCENHTKLSQVGRAPDLRPSSARRGYGPAWKRIRARVLASAGIPRELWSEYDVDHEPAYDPDVEPDHLAYKLTPRLHGEHSKKTNREDGGGWPRRGMGG